MPFEDIENLIAEIEANPDNRERQAVFRMVQPLVELHRETLQRVIELLRERGDEAFIEQLSSDPLLGDLLRAFELLPEDDIETRVSAALEEARPFLQRHGGDVRLLEMRGRVAVLEMSGSCHGCASSLITLKQGVESTLFRLVPDLRGVELSGITTPQIPAGAAWLPLAYWSDLRDGEWLKVQLFEDEVLVCTVDQRPFAFHNRCPQGGESLESGQVHHLFLACPGHGRRFDLRTGRCSDDSALRLHVLPVMVEDSVVKVAYEQPAMSG